MTGFSRWAIIRSGFRQHKGSWSNGCVDLYGMLCRRYGGNGNQVCLEEWSADPDHTADFIFRLSPEDTPPLVAIFGYSWGCGYGAVKLARALDRRGIDVDYMVLSDPVHYSLAAWRALIPAGLFRRIVITIPANVHHVWWFRQEVDKPCGHDLDTESPYTNIHEPEVLHHPHGEMDSAPEFHWRCLKVARMLFVGGRSEDEAVAHEAVQRAVHVDRTEAGDP